MRRSSPPTRQRGEREQGVETEREVERQAEPEPAAEPLDHEQGYDPWAEPAADWTDDRLPDRDRGIEM